MKLPITIEMHARGQYQVLDGDGIDIIGEYVSLADARNTKQSYELIETLLVNAEVLGQAYTLFNCNSLEAAQDCVYSSIFYAGLNDLRKMMRKPSYFSVYVEKQKEINQEARVAGHKHHVVVCVLNKDHVRLRIANMLEGDFSVSRVDEVWADLIKYNDADNLEAMAKDEMWLSECITAVIMS